MSRLYTGVHYPMGLDAGTAQGRRIGQLVLDRLGQPGDREVHRFSARARPRGAVWPGGRIGVDPAERTSLVTTGVFAHVRNPVFTAMVLARLGVVLMVPTWVSAAALSTLVAAVQLQVRQVEEPYLRAVHGLPTPPAPAGSCPVPAACPLPRPAPGSGSMSDGHGSVSSDRRRLDIVLGLACAFQV
jgi:hypothetical protein